MEDAPLRNRLLLLAIILGPSILGAGSFAEDSSLSYSGSTTIGMAILYEGALKAFTARTGYSFDAVDTISGSGKGIAKLLAGEVNLAGAGRNLTPQEKSQGLMEHRIAHDAIALWVHSDNPVTRLTRKQAKDVFTGRVRNWKEVGGDDRPIHLVLEPANEGMATMEVLQQILLDNQPFGVPAITCKYAREQVLEVSRDPDAVCAASMGFAAGLNATLRARLKLVALDGVLPTQKAVIDGTYPISRPLILATLGPPAGKVKAFVDFILSPEGQKIVARNFVPAL